VHDQLNASYASTSLIRRLPTFAPCDLAPNLQEDRHWNTPISASAPAVELNHDLKHPLFATDRLAVGSSRMMPGTGADPRDGRPPSSRLDSRFARASNPVIRLNPLRLSAASGASEKRSSGSAILLRRAAEGSRSSVEDVPPKGGTNTSRMTSASAFLHSPYHQHVRRGRRGAYAVRSAVSSASNSTLEASRQSRVHLTRIAELGPDPQIECLVSRWLTRQHALWFPDHIYRRQQAGIGGSSRMTLFACRSKITEVRFITPIGRSS